MRIHPSTLRGSIRITASKSMMQRACACALLRNGRTVIHNQGKSKDDVAALNIIRDLGADISEQGTQLIIDSKGIHPRNTLIHCGESGLSMRMFTPIIALLEQVTTVTGEGSLKKRSMNFFSEVLEQLQVTIRSNDHHIPIEIQGPLVPKDISVDGSQSSQYLTGLLLAYAYFLQNNPSSGPYTIEVIDLVSKPYVDMTLEMMRLTGLPVPEQIGYEQFIFSKSISPSTEDVHISIENDWSGAAFYLVAGAINGNITVEGMNLQSPQADKRIIEVLQYAGAGCSFHPDHIEVRKAPLQPFYFDAGDCPDLFPPLAALAACCNGTSVIKGISRLQNKESNRAETLRSEFEKLGIKITLQEDEMIIYGGTEIRGGTVTSHNDHRIAMACGVIALRAKAAVTIEQAEAIHKSYPTFFEDLEVLGAIIDSGKE